MECNCTGYSFQYEKGIFWSERVKLSMIFSCGGGGNFLESSVSFRNNVIRIALEKLAWMRLMYFLFPTWDRGRLIQHHKIISVFCTQLSLWSTTHPPLQLSFSISKEWGRWHAILPNLRWLFVSRHSRKFSRYHYPPSPNPSWLLTSNPTKDLFNDRCCTSVFSHQFLNIFWLV